VINMFFRPIIRLLTLPLNILTLGLFSLVVNAGIIMLLAMLIPNFSVANFWTAFLFSLLVSLVTAFFGAFIKED
jgi:putative membrane protein